MTLKAQTYDVIVYGATPGGISAAIAAARRGRKTLLIEPSQYIGGMMTSGLGRSDIPSLEASGSIFREFAARILSYYVDRFGEHSQQAADCNRGIYFEPSAASKIFNDMLDQEKHITLCVNERLINATVKDHTICSIVTQNADTDCSQIWQASSFVDASYEGDLAAKAGVPYMLGRESRDEWNEEFAGVLYMDYHPDKEIFPGSTGEGDHRIQAYNYRLCITQNPSNRIPFTKPLNYRREEYTSLLDDVREGRIRSIRDVLSITVVPNGKFDANNHHYCLCSTDLPEENTDYPEADVEKRERILERHRSYIEGLLWFLQTDEDLPESIRKETASWGYAADEFADNDHFPYQIYVREARRIKGEYVFSENDARLAPGLSRTPIQYDSIAVGAYQIDSHALRKREPAGQNRTLEGFLGLRWLTHPYQIPYGVMVPQKINGLIVPVAVSATHIGFGTIRMEPCWMQLGFAAGVAADLVMKQKGTHFRTLSIDWLQDELLQENQKIAVLNDVDWEHPYRIAAEYFACKGFLAENDARLDEPVTVSEASLMLAQARNLDGGRHLPALPATDRILPAGVDMGPRMPKEDFEPESYWKEHPYLTAHMALRWRKTVLNAMEREYSPSESVSGQIVSRGEWFMLLYEMLSQNRKRYAAELVYESVQV